MVDLEWARRAVSAAGSAVAAAVAMTVLAGCLASADRGVAGSGELATGVDPDAADGRAMPERNSDDDADADADRDAGAPWADAVTEIPMDNVRRPVAVLPELTAEAGELINFEGVLAVRSSVPALQVAQIRCARGDDTYESTFSTRNTSNDAEAVSSVTVRWLFRVPADGQYRCALYGHADHQTQPESYTMRVAEFPATRIDMDRESVVGAQVWPVSRDIEVENYATQNLFRHVTEVLPAANQLTLRAAIEVTNNYEGRLYEYDSEVLVNLTVEQLDESGRPCGQSWSTSARHRIPREVHHDKLEVGFDAIPVRPERSCTRQFSLHGSLELVGGSPVTIHGPRYSDITALMR